MSTDLTPLTMTGLLRWLHSPPVGVVLRHRLYLAALPSLDSYSCNYGIKLYVLSTNIKDGQQKEGLVQDRAK